jgi:1-deoxy-D-xylulose-5-phosphate reductoisomerase
LAQRLPWPAKPLNLAAYGQLTFEAPDLDRFPSIAIAREALRLGGGAPAAMNAANEVAVAAFLDRQIGFLDIAASVAGTLERMNSLGDLADRNGDAGKRDDDRRFALAALRPRLSAQKRHLD